MGGRAAHAAIAKIESASTLRISSYFKDAYSAERFTIGLGLNIATSNET
jgi:hypothetical protein